MWPPLQDTEAHKFLRESSEINLRAEMTAESLQYVLIKDVSPDEVAQGGGVMSEHGIWNVAECSDQSLFWGTVPHVIGGADEGPQDGWSSDWVLKSGPLECVTGILLSIFISPSVLFDWVLINLKKTGVYVCNADLTLRRARKTIAALQMLAFLLHGAESSLRS